MEKQKVQNIISKYLDSPFQHNNYDDLISIHYYLNDAVSVQLPHLSQVPDFKFEEYISREAQILKSLGHLSANPSKKFNNQIIDQTYSFFKENDSNINKEYPNYNPESLKYFVSQVISESKKELDNINSNYDHIKNLFIIYGDRGIGKTIFINYLVTSFNELFNSEKIIWVRLNLAEDFEGIKPDVVKWIKIKNAMVFFKYYYKKNHNFDDIEKILTKKIESKFKDSDIQLKRNLDDLSYLISVYSENKTSEKISGNLISRWLANEIMNYVASKGFSYLFILDNLDKLESTDRYRKKVNHLYLELQRLAGRDTNLYGTFIFVFRTETLEYLRNKTDGTLDKWNTLKFGIKSVEFNKIFSKRIEFIKKYIKNNTLKFKWDINDWPDHIEDFNNYLLQISDLKNVNQFINYLDQFYINNQRVKIQFLQMCYHDFLNSIHFSRQYRIVESMCRSGFIFPPDIYKYEINENNEYVVVSQSKVFDNIFIPLVTSFPYIPSAKKNIIPYSNTYLLCGIRILQFLQAYLSLNNDSTPHPMSFGLLSSILYKLFNYDKNLVYLLVEEYADYGLLKLTSGNTYKSHHRDNIRIFLLPKANFIINYSIPLSSNQKADSFGNIYPDYTNNFLHSIAYYNMCSIKSKINEVALKNEAPFFRAINIVPGSKLSLQQWVNWKIINSISLIRLFEQAYKIELESIDISRLNEPELNIYKNITHINFSSIKKNIVYQIGLIYNEMSSSEQQSFLNQLDKYLYEWG